MGRVKKLTSEIVGRVKKSTEWKNVPSEKVGLNNKNRNTKNEIRPDKKIPMISNWVKMTSFDFCTERVQTSSCHHCTSRSRHESLLLKNLIAARSFLCLEWEHLHLAEKILNYKWEGHWDFKFTNWLFFQVLELWEDKEQRKNGGKIKKYWVQL